jgi:hypothetical protein
MNNLTFSSDVIFVIASSCWAFIRARIYIYGSQAIALIRLILTVKSKSWVLENKFANVFNIFLHNLYHKIS